MNIIKYGFTLFGLTKAGKTTLAHHLVKNPLAGKVKEGNTTYYELKENAVRFKEAIIGQKNSSETQIPNECN
jgi:ABC-type cobalamin/Fe3+-siderophores transport system ATPase subunit